MLELLLFALVLLVVGSFAFGAISAAPFVPLRRRDINRLLELCQPRAGEILYDLGCGDGRIVIAAARYYNLKAQGYEVALLPYLVAKIKLIFLKSKLCSRADIYLKNFWRTNLNEADIVVCFLTPPAMVKLLPKLQRELKPGSRFVTYAFALPGQVPDKVSKPLISDVNIYLYTKIVQPVN